VARTVGTGGQGDVKAAIERSGGLSRDTSTDGKRYVIVSAPDPAQSEAACLER
jgi:hypothetical protein